MNKSLLVFSVALMPIVLAASPGDENWDSNFGVPGASGGITTITAASDGVYFGGMFESIGGIGATNVAKWNGGDWLPLSSGVNGVDSIIFASVRAGDNYYFAGSFSSAGGVNASNIARWDGTNWSSVGGGVNGVVFALASDGTNVYAGGNFTFAGGASASRVAKWDGTNWSALGIGIVPMYGIGSVDSLVVDGSELFVGGRFRNVGGIAATNVARWDGTDWHALAYGLRYYDGPGSENGAVRALAMFQGELFAGGAFRLAGNVFATNIARWNGSIWQPVGSGVNDTLSVSALAPNGNALFAAGVFLKIGGISANRIAKWESGAWSALGSGIGGTSGDGVSALGAKGADLFVAGQFPSAGSNSSGNLALWHIPHALSFSQTGNVLSVSWPATGTNFLLESAAALNPTSNWIEVPQCPVIIGDQLVVTQAMSGSNAFFRLRRK